uniref:arylamine N-acetyltransferase n=1 Tax=Pseudonaja textilis TaxID=8673 RepID=A0A670ZC66_PSETE
MWQPMALISEKNQPQTPGIFCFTEKDGVWYLHKVKREKFRMDSENKILCSDIVKNMTCKNIYLFTLQPKTIDDTQLTLMVKTGFEPIVFCFLAWYGGMIQTFRDLYYPGISCSLRLPLSFTCFLSF